VSYISFLTDFH